MSDQQLSAFGVVQSLMWGGASGALTDGMGVEARAIVSSVKEGGEPRGPWWAFRLSGAITTDGGVIFPEGLERLVGSGMGPVITRLLGGLSEILMVPMEASVAPAASDAPGGIDWVETSVRIVVGADVHEVRTYVRSPGVEAMAESFRAIDAAKAPEKSTPQGVAPTARADGPMEVPLPSAPPVAVRAHRWPSLEGEDSPAAETPGLDLFYDVPLTVTAELGRINRRVEDVVSMGPGVVVELDRMVGDAVDLFVNGQWIARGEVVVVEDNFGVRITEIGSSADRVSKLRLREGS